MLEEFLFAGFGGQGIMFAGQLLAHAAMSEGLNVTWIPSYGPEMRGGTASCMVVLSTRPIGSPLVRRPKVIVIFNNPSFERYEPLVAQDGLLVVNISLVSYTSHRSDIVELGIPATQLADQIGDTRVTNMVLLGAALTARPVLPLDAVRRALEKHIPEDRPQLVPRNFEALARGADCALGIACA